jgi:hypothetical protein
MNCPKCKAKLEKSGEVVCDGQTLDVYQCDVCIVPWHFGGETFDTALTFAVSASGQMLHPETLEPLDLN